METRINIAEIEPAAYKALLGLENYLAGTAISKTLKELIKIRASQINGCAFCINMHTKDARKQGETEQRIYLLNAWREAGALYTEEERAVLALTEEMTLITNGGVSDATYQKARSFFDEHQLAQVMIAIITINGWNRMAITTQLAPQ
ncbi:alkylhydroperoxidase AhpD family core domain-containing protein [Pedobacter westerhofensis]|uniref:Alkylhydroperoxidase AhpD family core domain-containing protein n=1 Tax=Pedobacter westerhofensis TaxID=425512 RepID=A0A521ATF2_9SPHI|nr:carboxymuconolactone decarboxylase family protein [Pedobacter westerhofensis]SMO38075.1 alkylhydroperoxidase AhpD family core domain-containing protein [Pedobacter westerhofensis]